MSQRVVRALDEQHSSVFIEHRAVDDGDRGDVREGTEETDLDLFDVSGIGDRDELGRHTANSLIPVVLVDVVGGPVDTGLGQNSELVGETPDVVDRAHAIRLQETALQCWDHGTTGVGWRCRVRIRRSGGARGR
jgi:hypothetical protein